MKLLLLASLLAAQTRVDLGRQTTGVQPQGGTMVVCDQSGCRTHLDGAFVLYRVAPPIGPGACSAVGTGAIAVDAAGYLYLCSSTAPFRWMRSAQPMSASW